MQKIFWTMLVIKQFHLPFDFHCKRKTVRYFSKYLLLWKSYRFECILLLLFWLPLYIHWLWYIWGPQYYLNTYSYKMRKRLCLWQKVAFTDMTTQRQHKGTFEAENLRKRVCFEWWSNILSKIRAKVFCLIFFLNIFIVNEINTAPYTSCCKNNLINNKPRMSCSKAKWPIKVKLVVRKGLASFICIFIFICKCHIS